jgi:O-antigen/teichoic acid export membrane protein
MSRFRRAVHSVASGYAVLAVTAVYGLASVPLALHYLSEERFGLWVFMASVAGYLALVDLGMSGSLARLLIDYKDQRAGGAYGSLVKTGWLVLAIQGLLLFLVGTALAPFLSRMPKIPLELRGEFVALVCWQSATLGVAFALRIFSNVLQAYQRIDVFNYTQMTGLGLNLALLWAFFHTGHGVLSLAWAGLISTFISALCCLAACVRLKLLPPAGGWGRLSWARFVEVFDYGKDMFLVAVGTQMVMFSQSFIITWRLGLAAAGLWGAGTKVFGLVSQVVWRVSDTAGPAFSEMLVRGERDRLRERYRAVVVLTASLSGFAAVSYALCNSFFVTVWTSHKFAWPAANDLLLGLWLIAMAVLHCHNGFVLLTKQVGFMRYVYFLEGVVFIGAALLTAEWGGLPAVIACSLLCSLGFSGAYGVWRISRYFGFSLAEVGLHWLAPMGRLLLFFVPVAAVCWWGLSWVKAPALRLGCHAAVSGLAGGGLFLRYGLPASLQGELLSRLPPALRPLLRQIFGPSQS